MSIKNVIKRILDIDISLTQFFTFFIVLILFTLLVGAFILEKDSLSNPTNDELTEKLIQLQIEKEKLDIELKQKQLELIKGE